MPDGLYIRSTTTGRQWKVSESVAQRSELLADCLLNDAALPVTGFCDEAIAAWIRGNVTGAMPVDRLMEVIKVGRPHAWLRLLHLQVWGKCASTQRS